MYHGWTFSVTNVMLTSHIFINEIIVKLIIKSYRSGT